MTPLDWLVRKTLTKTNKEYCYTARAFWRIWSQVTFQTSIFFLFLFLFFCWPFKDGLICQSSVIVYMPFCLVIVHHASLPLPMPLEDCFIIVVLRIYQTVQFLTLNEPKRQKQIFWHARPTHPRSLIRVFVVRMKTICILGYPKCAQLRFWSDCANAQADLNLRGAHMFGCRSLITMVMSL